MALHQQRSRGRPAVGARVAVRLPAEVMTRLDEEARAQGDTRAATIRRLLTTALELDDASGVDRAQVRRMLAMTPLERIRHAANVANGVARLRAAAKPPS